IMTQEAMQEMTRQGAVAQGSWTAIGRTGIGVAVRDGAPKPDIGSPEALKQTLLATKSLVYVDPAQGGTSGIHFASVLQRLGIADAVKSKPSTASRIASPGNTTTHGACSMNPRPSESISPSDGVGGRTPTPRNDSAASTRIAIAISTEAWTSSGVTQLGTM